MKHFTNPEEKRKYLTEEKIPTLVLNMAVPSIISMLITSFYNMADTFFVGQIGTTATAAVGVIFPLMSIIQALGFTFGHGSGNYISRKLGQGEVEDAKKMYERVPRLLKTKVKDILVRSGMGEITEA